MSWRVRVGIFNGVKPKHHRIRRGYSRSDVAHTVILINNLYTYIFQPYFTQPQGIHTFSRLNTIFTLIASTLFIFFACVTYSKQHHSSPNRLKIIYIIIILYLPLLLLLSGDIHPNPGPTQKNYSVCHFNARSLTAPERLSYIEATLCNIHAFDIMAVSETHLVPDYKV